MYVLDTDLIVILQHAESPERRRLLSAMAGHRPTDFFVTVVSLHEQVMGANKYISRARKPTDIVRGYRMFEQSLLTFSQYQLIPFDEPSASLFEQLRQAGVRIGTMDLRIASIALSHGHTLLTRNTVDFQKVLGLQIEDWTTDPA